jgi:NADPH-dependent 2,4-dienoyl-CoA reductase/sulfur reductase-like enzyme
MGHIVIIGNGVSGVTCARNVRKQSNDKITIISSESKYFYSRTALMYVYMGHMKFENTQPYENNFWEKNNIDLVFDHVTAIDTEAKQLQLDKSSAITYDKLVLALGSKSNMFGWPGQDLIGVQGLYNKQDLEQMELNTVGAKRAVIVGGGLIGVEMAEMLLSRGISVTFLVREGRFWGNVLPKEEGELIAKHMVNEHHVDLRFNSNLKEILSDETGVVRAVVVAETGEEIPCQFVGLTAGVSPNIGLVKDTAINTGRGILVDEYLATNIDGVYAIGDCAEFINPPAGRRPIEQVWYTGRMQGEVLAKTLTGTPTQYEPSFWFNSAKFFDIEYQTYGTVLSELQEGESNFYWQHPTKNLAVKMVFDTQSNLFKGINVFGIRMRHHMFDNWLNENKTADYVLTHLADANFEPELFRTFEKEILAQYNQENNKQLKPERRSWKRMLKALTIG